MKCVLAFAAIAALAAGACNKNVKVKSQTDLNTVNACTKFEADVVVDGVSGIGALSLDNVEEITGQLIIQNMYDLQTVSLGALTSAGSFKVLNNTNVYKVDVPQLTSVDDFQIIVNPNLKELTYSNISSTTNFQIIGTHVSALGVFADSKPGNIEILSNTDLQKLDFSAVTETAGYINIANNGKNANVTFSSLTQVGGNVSFADAATLDISKLSSVKDDFSLYTNDFTNLTVPALSTADKSITISGNSFKAIAFPKLTEIGSSLNIVNNTNFKSISKTTFPKLGSVPGSIVLQGSFDNITFPSLKTVDGQVSLSGKGKLSCDDAEKALSAADNFDCSLETVDDSSDGGSEVSGGDDNESHDTSGAAAHTTVVAVIGGAIALAAACI
ncbi:cell wall protein Ecm33 [Coemansia sp. RSA 2711]|nr:cell wall protein Ecm33 [Coemansia sp. RSA 2711]KAJ1847473.1 cell wall protein Ecm33 [Coemansia sp. RSA 2708]